eukprot:13918180-Heterocapsa_arctica.AAC.1
MVVREVPPLEGAHFPPPPAPGEQVGLWPDPRDSQGTGLDAGVLQAGRAEGVGNQGGLTNSGGPRSGGQSRKGPDQQEDSKRKKIKVTHNFTA